MDAVQSEKVRSAAVESGVEEFDTIVVGGGQAGLAIGRELVRQGRNIIVLDAHRRVGEAWRSRWDSLRLNTPAKYDGLPGVRFDAPRLSFPSKDAMADYLETYVETQGIPVRLATRVERLYREDDRYVAVAGSERFVGRNVVIATGCHEAPRVPDFAEKLDPSIAQVHSSKYRGPDSLPEGGVLVVGCGNSGAEIARDVSTTHETWISGKVPGQLPFRHGPVVAALVFPIVRFAGLHVLTADTRLGRKAEPHIRHHSPPLIRTRVPELLAAGVHMVPRTVGTVEGRPELEDGASLDVRSVIWCTGWEENFPWVDLPGFEEGRPAQYRGVVRDHPGLYLLGLEFLYAEGSGTLPGIGRDARYVAHHIAAKRPVTITGA